MFVVKREYCNFYIVNFYMNFNIKIYLDLKTGVGKLWQYPQNRNKIYTQEKFYSNL